MPEMFDAVPDMLGSECLPELLNWFSELTDVQVRAMCCRQLPKHNNSALHAMLIELRHVPQFDLVQSLHQ